MIAILQDSVPDTTGQAAMNSFKESMTNAFDNADAAGAFGMLAGIGMGFIIFLLALMVFMIACQWKIYSKAGKPGWACLVPIYNIIVLLEIVGKPWWWFFFMIIPIVNIVILIIVIHRLSLSFGKDGGFTAGLILLGIVFYPILAFGSATYVGPGGAAKA